MHMKLLTNDEKRIGRWVLESQLLTEEATLQKIYEMSMRHDTVATEDMKEVTLCRITEIKRQLEEIQ